MKLTPFESAIERVADRILRKHKKELDAYVTLLYTRAVGQAVEFLQAKTSPAKKANDTRKREQKLRQCVLTIRDMLATWRSESNDVTLGKVASIVDMAAACLAETRKDGES